MRKQLQSSQQVVGRGCQGVLVGTTVDLLTHQLLGCRVGHRPNAHIGRGESTDVVDAARNAEVGQQDSLFAVVNWVSMMFAGFTSRCSKPCLWA